MIRYTRFETPLGTVLATAAGDCITGIDFVDAKYAKPVATDWKEEPRFPVLAECVRQLGEYYACKRRRFELPLAPEGTPFQRHVWEEIARVPFGQTITYSELARRAGAPGSARAAGAATGRNPVGVVIPCHRIVGANGSLTGYAGGLDRKQRLLELEGVLQPCLV